jgi:hypothetical protein
MTTTFQAFKDRIVGDLLPTFCDDRGWGCGGFKEDWKNVTEKDAADFLLALDAGLIEHRGGGLYKAPKSLASEQFWCRPESGWNSLGALLREREGIVSGGEVNRLIDGFCGKRLPAIHLAHVDLS